MGRSNRQHLLSLLVIVVVLFVVLGAFSPESYLTYGNFASMGFQMAEIGILALAIGVAFLGGGLDLSVVAVANLAAVTVAEVTTRLEPSMGAPAAIAVAVLAALAVGLVAGLINGSLVSRLRVHPIVITLGTLTLFTGIGTGLTGGSTIFGTGSLTPFGRGVTAGIPTPFLVFVVCAVVLAIATTRTRWGYKVYMVGSSERVSRFARMRVERLQLTTYLVSGSLASLAGLIILARTNSANVSFGSSYLILAILVAVLAGVNPYGGQGRILFVVLSMLAMQQLSTGLNMALAGWDGANFAREFAWGVLLIAALGWSQRNASSGLARMVRGWFGRDGEDDSSREGTDSSIASPVATSSSGVDGHEGVSATQETGPEEGRT